MKKHIIAQVCNNLRVSVHNDFIYDPQVPYLGEGVDDCTRSGCGVCSLFRGDDFEGGKDEK